MNHKMENCAICAWRENCQKKFSVSGKNVRCPDFARDLSIKEDKKEEDMEETKNKK